MNGRNTPRVRWIALLVLSPPPGPSRSISTGGALVRRRPGRPPVFAGGRLFSFTRQFGRQPRRTRGTLRHARKVGGGYHRSIAREWLHGLRRLERCRSAPRPAAPDRLRRDEQF